MQNSQKNLNASLALLARSSFLVFITVLISKILTYVYKVIIAREYGAEAYGIFVLSLMVVGWLAIFSKMGFGEGLVRFIPIYRAKKREETGSYLLNKVVIISGGLSILAGVLLFVASNALAAQLFNNSELAVFLKIFSFAVPCMVLSSIYISVLRAYEEIFWVSLIGNILQSIVNVGVILLLIFFSAGTIAISISYTLGMAAVLIASYVLVRKKVPLSFNAKAIKEKKKVFKEFKSYSTPLIFFGIVISVLHWTDSFMIGVLRSVREVGLYNAAVPIAFLITVSIDLFRQLFLPLVTKEYSKNEFENVKQLSKQIGKWVYVVSLPLLALFFLYPAFFIQLLFGEEFIVATASLRILAVGALFVSLFEVSKDLLSMQGKSKLVLIDTLIAFFINVSLNLFLIPLIGITGAAIATTISLASLGIMFAYQAYRDLKVIPLRKKMLNITGAAILATVIVFLFGALMPTAMPWMFARLIIFGLSYLALLFILKCLDKNDMAILSKIKTRIINKK